jgi:hypothetical protein
METHFKIIGIILVFLAVIHAAFPRYFKWQEDLKPLSLINRQMMIIHTFFVALVVFLIGIMCLTNSHDLVETKFGQQISLGIGLFWGIRLIIQFVGYSSKLWKGKTFETIMHILFSLLWAYLTWAFLVVGSRW